MPDPSATPSPETVRRLQDEADQLRTRAEDDGVIPDVDDIPEDGVGPQTSIVP